MPQFGALRTLIYERSVNLRWAAANSLRLSLRKRLPDNDSRHAGGEIRMLYSDGDLSTANLETCHSLAAYTDVCMVAVMVRARTKRTNVSPSCRLIGSQHDTQLGASLGESVRRASFSRK